MNAKERLLKLLADKGIKLENRPNAGIAYTGEEGAAAAIALREQSEKEFREETGDIEYNEQQLTAIQYAKEGHSFVITGPAGSGKTTTVRGVISALQESGRIGTLADCANHKWLHAGRPSIACVGFTNKSVENIKKSLPKDLRANCMTIHKLLEFQPEYVTSYDEATGEEKTTMQFVPSRHEYNPIPRVDVLVIEEATMTDINLWNTLVNAIKHNCQVILIGDIHQLPPVFGKSIFIWAMQLGAKIVELTHIYRQALESPIIELAHRVRSGKQIPAKEAETFNKATPSGKVTIHFWKKKLGDTAAIKAMGMFLPEMIDKGAYDPMKDVILTPYNKSFGTIAINQIVAGHMAKKETDPDKKEVWEIYAGIKKVYFRIGDKVLHNKSEAFITEIRTNSGYYGKRPRMPSTTLSYNGVESDPQKRLQNAAQSSVHTGMDTEETIDAMLESLGSHTNEGEKVARHASHIVKVYCPDLDTHYELKTSGEVNALDLGYALTVHKSQGSEYDRVFLLTHGSQSNMFFRELLYTGITRAAKELYVVCEPNFFVKGVVTQRVPGNTLAEKLESFERQLAMTKNGKDEIPQRKDLLVDLDIAQTQEQSSS